MSTKDIAEKHLFNHAEIFADIINVLLFHGKQVVNPPTTKVAGFPSFKERNLLTKWYSNPSASKSRRTNSPQES